MPVRAITDIDRLRRINEALIHRVERSVDQQGNAFSLFQTAIALEGQVRQRTDELTQTLRRLETTNQALSLAKDTAEQANSSKTRFLAAASHDVLQPLNAAQLGVSALADLQTTTEGRHIAAQVQRALQTMDELLRTLLDISKLDAGVVQPQLADVALGPLFQSLQSDFSPLAEKRGLHLRFRPTRAVIRTDRSMFRRALQNIISNALRYTSRGGVLVGARHASALTVVSISDTGRGIAPDEASAIYDEFRRGRQMPEGDEGGLGLGLSIVKRMVEALQHGLSFSSRPGHGTTFRISAPRVDGAAPPPPKAAPRRPLKSFGLDGARILLVENDQQVLDAMTTRLRQWHCLVRGAKDGSGAMLQLGWTDWQPDLIIADQNLDGGDLGIETIAAVRAAVERPVPALLVTATTSEELAQACRAADVELMCKPVKPAELRALMAHLLA